MTNHVRVRFAPSPTGHLHIGGLRAAFFNWLFARHNNGTYLLRIEDTDIERSKDEYTQSILNSFVWTNLAPDEPALIQSTRIGEHRAIAEKLIKEGKAYRCYCTPEEVIERIKARFGADTLYSKYDEYCRKRTDAPNKPSAIRFAVPHTINHVTFQDLIRGTVTFERDQLDDFIIVRTDGVPIYNFVVVLDDAFMRISHVIRGEDHISNTPKQILLYQACGYTLPQFAHLPMILGPSGDRLSKRDGAVSVLEYKHMGYLPDALLNYLVRLGWAHGDQEIFTRTELLDFFTLDHVSKKGAIFDPAKLDWVNGVYIRARTAQELFDYIVKAMEPRFAAELASWNHEQIITLIKLYQDRIKTLRELIEELRLLHSDSRAISDADRAQWLSPESLKNLASVAQTLEELPAFSVDIIGATVKEVCSTLNIKLVALAQPIRLALVGKTSSPGVFDLMAALGKDETIKRLRALLHTV